MALLEVPLAGIPIHFKKNKKIQLFFLFQNSSSAWAERFWEQLQIFLLEILSFLFLEILSSHSSYEK